MFILPMISVNMAYYIYVECWLVDLRYLLVSMRDSPCKFVPHDVFLFIRSGSSIDIPIPHRVSLGEASIR